MNAQVVSSYRVVLKQLARAVQTKPHYVQDIRFLLSRPLVSTSIATEEEQQQQQQQSRAVHSRPALCDEVKPVERVKCSQEQQQQQQQRKHHAPALHSACPSAPHTWCARHPWTADARALFRACQTDLRNSIDAAHTTLDPHSSPENTIRTTASSSSPIGAPASSLTIAAPLPGSAAELLTPPAFSPVALQMLRCRELLWLRNRLGTVLHKATARRLAHVLNVAAGPTEADFIPDQYFDKEESAGDSGNDVSGNKSANRAASREEEGATADSSTFFEDEANCHEDGDDESESVSATDFVSQATPATAQPRVQPVHSAGAIGAQREMYVLRHMGSFPLARHFLKGVGRVSEQQLEMCTHSHECLQKLVRECVPREYVCRDNHVRLAVEVCAFDARFHHDRRTAALGYFATSHRQFMLRFRIDPINCSDQDTQIQMVNSYFARMDVTTGELMEEVGYLHSYDVRCMLQERDLPMHTSSPPAALNDVSNVPRSSADDFTECKNSSNDDRDNGCADGGADNNTKEHVANAAHSVPSTEANDANTGTEARGRGRHFDLFFLNTSDGPCVLKGLFFYKRGCSTTIRNAVIQVISFGPVLLSSE